MAQSLIIPTLRKDFAVVSMAAVFAFVVGVLLVNILTGTGAEAGAPMTDAQEIAVAETNSSAAQPLVGTIEDESYDGIRVVFADGSEDAARRAYLETLAGAR